MGSGTKIRIGRVGTHHAEEVDRAAWHQRASALYEELRSPAIGLVRRAYGRAFGADEIEDIYSSAWLGTLKSLERRQAELEDEEIRAYLLTAVANHAHKEMRRRHRKPIAPLEAAGSVAEATDSLDYIVANRETGDETRDVLSSLPPRRRAVMLLRYGWGLEPSEICGMVKGLSPRAYRKEITKGVDDLTERIRLVRDGGWCEEREPILKAFAARIATEDEALQAKHHMSHCRSCSEFVGKLTGHLNDLGSSLLLPGALDAADGNLGFLDRMREGLDSARDSVLGVASRGEVSEGVSLATTTRGAGAAAVGGIAKLSGLGAGAKVALACVGGGIAATACVAVGVNPFESEAAGDGRGDAPAKVMSVDGLTDPKDVVPQLEAPGPTKPEPRRPEPSDAQPQSEPAAAPVLEADTPPTTQEFGVESAAQPTAPPSSSSAGGDAVSQEFGP